MERIDRLEAKVDRLDSQVGDLRVTVATLAERVSHLPSKGFIVKALSFGVTLIGALIVVGDKLRALV